MLLAAVACHGGPVPHPPLPAGCEPSRVGKVTIEGATAAEVAPLAVLDGTLDDPPRTQRVAEVAAQLLRARGYSRAKVAVQRVHGCGVELRVAVERGPRFRIAELAFVGAPEPLPASAVADALGTINAVGGAYIEDRLRRALDHLAHRLHDAGWLDAAIDPPVATYDERAGTVRIAIAVHAGSRYRIGSVVARGAGAAARAAVIDALGLRGGEYYDAAALRAGIARARRSLDRRIELRLIPADAHIDLEATVR